MIDPRVMGTRSSDGHRPPTAPYDATTLQEVAVDAKDRDDARVAELGGALARSASRTGCDVGRRAGDDAQDLGRRRLLLEGLGQLAGALLDLLLQVGVRLLELPGHAVELAGQRLQLVAGADVDAAGRASPAPRRAAPAWSARIGVTMRRASKRLASSGEREAERQQDRRAVHRGVDRRERLRQRQVHEDQPAERRDRRRGGEDLAAGAGPGRSSPPRAPRPVAGRARAPPRPGSAAARSVFCSTRLMSGWAMRWPRTSTT